MCIYFLFFWSYCCVLCSRASTTCATMPGLGIGQTPHCPPVAWWPAGLPCGPPSRAPVRVVDLKGGAGRGGGMEGEEGRGRGGSQSAACTCLCYSFVQHALPYFECSFGMSRCCFSPVCLSRFLYHCICPSLAFDYILSCCFLLRARLQGLSNRRGATALFSIQLMSTAAGGLLMSCCGLSTSTGEWETSRIQGIIRIHWLLAAGTASACPWLPCKPARC
jgi:hypothetical protein